MLKKNVYILYGPGYCGSYINWAINHCDLDRRPITVDNPVNPASDTKLGGAGTSHLHTRIPTHQTLPRHLIWVLYNKPIEPRIYIINLPAGNGVTQHEGIYQSIRMISAYDPEGIFISINDHGDPDIRSLCEINCVIKWPTYILATLKDTAWNENLKFTLHDDFDAFNCADDLVFRDWAVKTPFFFTHNSPVDRAQLDQVLQINVNWYKLRNQYQPHEVNEKYYVTDFDMADRFFDVGVLDVIGEKFPALLEDILSRSGISDSYDLNYLKSFHHNYTQSQTNMQWFDSVKHWRETGKIDSYILSHGIIQAQIIREMLKDCPSMIEWPYYHRPIDEINQFYQASKSKN